MVCRCCSQHHVHLLGQKLSSFASASCHDYHRFNIIDLHPASATATAHTGRVAPDCTRNLSNRLWCAYLASSKLEARSSGTVTRPVWVVRHQAADFDVIPVLVGRQVGVDLPSLGRAHRAGPQGRQGPPGL